MFKPEKLSGTSMRAYSYILNGILAGRYSVDMPVSEEELAEKMNSSRTPIREALLTLEQEGQVRRVPRRGWFISRISTGDIEEVFELRKLLEVYALTHACEIIPEKELQKLYCQMDELREDSEQEEYFETDRRLHGMILKYCGNRRLIEVWNRLNMQIERIRVLSAGKPERLLQSRKEHMNVVEAMIGRDIAKAEFLLAEHIDHVRDSVLEVSKYIS